MSIFDLLRGFFWVPGGHYREGRRDPFFDAMTHDDDEDDEDDDGFYYEGFRGDPFDNTWRFGFSFGPDGMRIVEPPMFGHVLKEMEEIFSQLGQWEGQPSLGHLGVPIIEAPPPEDRPGRDAGAPSGNPLRDFMLKSPGGRPQGPPAGPSGEPGHDGTPPCGTPHFPRPPFHDLTPFSKFHDAWRGGLHRDREEERKQDGDLDSAVSSGGLDQILTPPAAPSQPRGRSFFQSVTVTKVVKPDGTVEERRTVSDGRGNEETTVTRSGGPGSAVGPQHHSRPRLPGDHPSLPDMDDHAFFSKFFGGFK